MTYKKHLRFLLILIGVLVLLYTGGLVFNYNRGNVRSISHTWLDSRAAGMVTRIAFDTGWDDFELVKRNDLWFVSYNESVFPARQLRLEDFLNFLTTRSSWTVRSTTASAHENFGLDDNALRVTLFQDNSVLLDLLVGDDDFARRETYVRQVGQNEVRSGDNILKSYLTNPVSAWYNLRLIPETEGGNIGTENIQRLSVFTPEGVQTFTRRNRAWEITGFNIENADHGSIENYIRTVLNAEGVDFVDSVSSFDPMFNHSRIVIEFGTGNVTTIRFSQDDEEGNRLAHVTGRDIVYLIPVWRATRLFPDDTSFVMR